MINWIGGEGDSGIVLRVLITSLSNSSSSIPERILSDKLSREIRDPRLVESVLGQKERLQSKVELQ